MRLLLSDLGIQARFVSAIDGRSLSLEQRSRYCPRRAQRVYGCEMTDNEIACYLSHLLVYEQMVAEDIPAALILEDDVSCTADLKRVLDDVEALPGDWRVIRLQSTKVSVAGGDTPKTRGEKVAEVGPRKVFRVRTSVLGGCAYVIRRSAAEAMLARSARIEMPVDQTLDRYWENGIIPYVMRPTPVWHEDLFASDIGARGRKLAGRRRGVVLRRRMQRMLDAVNKRVFWLAFRVPLLGETMAAMGVGSARLAMRALWAMPQTVKT